MLYVQMIFPWIWQVTIGQLLSEAAALRIRLPEEAVQSLLQSFQAAEQRMAAAEARGRRFAHLVTWPFEDPMDIQ